VASCVLFGYVGGDAPYGGPQAQSSRFPPVMIVKPVPPARFASSGQATQGETLLEPLRFPSHGQTPPPHTPSFPLRFSWRLFLSLPFLVKQSFDTGPSGFILLFPNAPPAFVGGNLLPSPITNNANRSSRIACLPP